MTRNPDLFRTIALLAFLAGGLLLVRAGVLPMWAWNLLTLGAIVARVLTRMDKYSEKISITDLGVTRTHGSRLRKQMTESVSWDELARVEAISREAGTQKKDVLFLLYGSDDSGVAVPAMIAQQHDLVGELRRRLPGRFLDDQLEQAMAASERQTFVIWERHREA